MGKAEYQAKWKDPRWQKKRLEILERDDWTCQICGDKESTLTVHHRYYLPRHEPWEYSDECLTTLCEGCHQNETEAWPDVITSMVHALKSRLWSGEADYLVGCIECMQPDPISSTDAMDLMVLLEWLAEHPRDRSAVRDLGIKLNIRVRQWFTHEVE